MKIVFLSSWDTPDFPYLIDSFREAGLPVNAVIFAGTLSDRDKEIIKNRTEAGCFSKKLLDADVSDIPFYFVTGHNSKSSIKILDDIKPDIVVNAGTPNILKGKIFDMPRLGILNSHPGILPEYRGCTCVEWALYNDDPVGATCHFIVPEIDKGPILYKKQMIINREWSYKRIRTQIIFHSHDVLIEGLRKAIELDKNYKELPRPKGGRYYGVIDGRSMRRVLNKIARKKYKLAV